MKNLLQRQIQSQRLRPIKRILRIEKQGECITLKALVKRRFKLYGFGTFLENIKPGEISISKEALAAMLKCKYLSGIQGMEIFPGNMLAWGSQECEETIALDIISLHKDAKDWFKQCCYVEAECS